MLDLWIFICVYLEMNIHKHTHAPTYPVRGTGHFRSLEIWFGTINPSLFHVVSFPGLFYQYRTITGRIELNRE